MHWQLPGNYRALNGVPKTQFNISSTTNYQELSNLVDQEPVVADGHRATDQPKATIGLVPKEGVLAGRRGAAVPVVLALPDHLGQDLLGD